MMIDLESELRALGEQAREIGRRSDGDAWQQIVAHHATLSPATTGMRSVRRLVSAPRGGHRGVRLLAAAVILVAMAATLVFVRVHHGAPSLGAVSADGSVPRVLILPPPDQLVLQAATTDLPTLDLTYAVVLRTTEQPATSIGIRAWPSTDHTASPADETVTVQGHDGHLRGASATTLGLWWDDGAVEYDLWMTGPKGNDRSLLLSIAEQIHPTAPATSGAAPPISIGSVPPGYAKTFEGPMGPLLPHGNYALFYGPAIVERGPQVPQVALTMSLGATHAADIAQIEGLSPTTIDGRIAYTGTATFGFIPQLGAAYSTVLIVGADGRSLASLSGANMTLTTVLDAARHLTPVTDATWTKTVGTMLPPPGTNGPNVLPSTTTVSSKLPSEGRGVTSSVAAQMVIVPAVAGRPFSDMQAVFASLGLTLARAEDVFSDQYPVGTIVHIEPFGQGVSVPVGTTLTVNVSKGPDVVVVPRVTGMTISDAVAAILAAGLKPGVITGPVDKKVTAVTPIEGSVLARGSVINVTLG